MNTATDPDIVLQIKAIAHSADTLAATDHPMVAVTATRISAMARQLLLEVAPTVIEGPWSTVA
jgi:hypothetical protein